MSAIAQLITESLRRSFNLLHLF